MTSTPNPPTWMRVDAIDEQLIHRAYDRGASQTRASPRPSCNCTAPASVTGQDCVVLSDCGDRFGVAGNRRGGSRVRPFRRPVKCVEHAHRPRFQPRRRRSRQLHRSPHPPRPQRRSWSSRQRTEPELRRGRGFSTRTVSGCKRMGSLAPRLWRPPSPYSPGSDSSTRARWTR